MIFPSKPISKEPLAPVYAQNHSRFADVINWVVYATIIADEKGITQGNVDAMVADPPERCFAFDEFGPLTMLRANYHKPACWASRASCRRRWDWVPRTHQPRTPSTRSSSRWGTTTTSSSVTWCRWA